MAITKYPVSSGIIPTKIRNYSSEVAGATQNTWYTLVDITGQGILSRVIMIAYISSQFRQNDNMEIIITIDGVAVTIAPVTPEYAVGLLYDTGIHSLEWIGHCYFLTSLKVEMRHTYAGTGTIFPAIQYSLV